ncbi:tetratricopeptide repeat protein [Kitasatospora sp. NPDC001683]
MTLATRCNLGSFHHHAGHRDEAVSLLTDVVEARARLLPPDNGELVATRVSLAAVLTARGRTLLPEDTAGAWRDAGAAVQTVGPCLADAPTAYGPALADAYRLAADALAVDGQPQAAAPPQSRRDGSSGGQRGADRAREGQWIVSGSVCPRIFRGKFPSSAPHTDR